jgi:hypothetical protein
MKAELEMAQKVAAADLCEREEKRVIIVWIHGRRQKKHTLRIWLMRRDKRTFGRRFWIYS